MSLVTSSRSAVGAVRAERVTCMPATISAAQCLRVPRRWSRVRRLMVARATAIGGPSGNAAPPLSASFRPPTGRSHRGQRAMAVGPITSPTAVALRSRPSWPKKEIAVLATWPVYPIGARSARPSARSPRRGRGPSAGRERQLEHLCTRPSVADRHRCPGLDLPSHQRQGDRAQPRGQCTAAEAPHRALPERELLAGPCGLGQEQAAQVTVGPALVVKAGDRLLAHVAALGEADRPLVEAGLLGYHRVVEVDSESRPPSLDAQALDGLLGHC